MFLSCFRVNAVARRIVSALFLTIVRNVFNVFKITSRVIYELVKQYDISLIARNRNWIKMLRKIVVSWKSFWINNVVASKNTFNFFEKITENLKKKSLKTFRLDIIRRHFDKREKTFFIQNCDLLDLLSNLNSD